MNIDGIRGFTKDDLIIHPWVNEARYALKTSNIINIYGPFRHGKTSLGELIAEQPNDADDLSYLKISLFQGVFTWPQFVQKSLRYLGSKFKIPVPDEENLSNLSLKQQLEILVKKLDDCTKIARINGDFLTIYLDELEPLFFNSEFKAVFPDFLHAIKDRPSIRLAIGTIYPLSLWVGNDINGLVVPEIRVRKWDKPAIAKFFNSQANYFLAQAGYRQKYNQERTAPLIDILWGKCGGSPQYIIKLFELIADDICYPLIFPNMKKRHSRCIKEFPAHIDYLFGNIHDDSSRTPIRVLRLANFEERCRAIHIFRKLAEGDIFVPRTPFDQAAAMHLRVSGCVAETPDGCLRSAGTLYVKLAKKGPDDGDVCNLHTLMKTTDFNKFRLEPIMRQRWHLLLKKLGNRFSTLQPA